MRQSIHPERSVGDAKSKGPRLDTSTSSLLKAATIHDRCPHTLLRGYAQSKWLEGCWLFISLE